MPSHVATPHAVKPTRFFALTAERLDAIHQHRLTRADIQVWAHVELNARPRQPVAFTLEGIADQLHIGVATVRRAVRRLLDVRLLVGFFEGNRYRLAPAAGAFGQADENLSRVEGFPARTPRQRVGSAIAVDAGNRSDMAGKADENLPSRAGNDADNQGAVPDSVGPQTSCSKKQESFLELSIEALVRIWGMFPAVAERMVTTYGEDRVSQVMAWGEHLKATGKLKSRGWCYQALERGWAVPNTFNAACQEAQEGRINDHQVPKRPSKEEQERIVRWHMSRKDEVMRVEGRRLAALWDVALESFEVTT
jgi:hypothetical protein